MASELQRLVESLGNRLGRSVAIDDPGLHLLAYNAHDGEVDQARTGSIMKRRLPRELVDYVLAEGAGTATDLFTVSASGEHGLDIPRIGMPVCHQNGLLGFIWLLASEGPVTEEEADALRSAAEAASIILHREYLIGELTRGRERELTRDLVADVVAVRTSAVEQLLGERLFSAHPALALVVEVNRADGSVTDGDRLALAAGAEFGRSHRGQRHALTLERPDHVILLLTQNDQTDGSIVELGRAIRERVLAEAGGGRSCWIGIGAIRADLVDINDSYAEARRAAGVARIVGVLGPVVRYADLGVYGILAELSADKLANSLHPGLRTLLDHRSHGEDILVHTLEVFLDNAGDVKRTAEQLCVHRTSLYYRLRRIEEITGLDLSTGDDRLALHLGLRIAQMIEIR